MAAILGIDAAWTPHQPSGVALIVGEGPRWSCQVVAPSYESFIAACRGVPVKWELQPVGTAPVVKELVEAGEVMAAEPITTVAIDMPMSRAPFSSRRVADGAVSREFGGRWCSTHTPNERRPGRLGTDITTAFLNLGFELVTTASPGDRYRSLIEVYPHPALLALLDRPRRVPYKTARAARYWPTLRPSERCAALLKEFHAILRALEQAFGPVPLELPSSAPHLAHLKRYEDGLDALISAWVGTLFVNGHATPLGDEDAAVWCPSAAMSHPL